MKYKLILASASPRRQQLLKDAGFDFEVRLKEIPENYPENLPSEQIPEYLAQLKAEAFKNDLKKDELLITSDTIVLINGKVLGKPTGRENAIEILKELSGDKHTVITGICLTTQEKQKIFSVDTDVYFQKLSEQEIEFYIDNFKPYDKAGAYGIQEWIGYVGIERIDGSFYNVMGLPIQILYQKLKEFGVTPFK